MVTNPRDKGADDEETLRKPLLISDAFDELRWVGGRGG